MDRSEHPAVTQRPPAYAELLVDSTDRYPNGYPTIDLGVTTSSDWRTNFQQNVLYGYLTRLAVSQIQFEWNLPTIITGYNDYFAMVTGAGGINVTLQQGFYTPTSLAAELQAALIAAGLAAATVAYSLVTGSFTITCGGADTARFQNPELNDTPTIAARTLETLGFLNSLGKPLAATITGSQPTMVATKYIDICSTYLTKYQRVKDSTSLKTPTVSNIIARVYPVAPNTRVATTGDTALADGNGIGANPFTLCIDYNTPKFIKWSPEEAVSNFDLQLRDEFGELVPFDVTNGEYGCEYQLTILASES